MLHENVFNLIFNLRLASRIVLYNESMKYCKTCKRYYEDSYSQCPTCQNRLIKQSFMSSIKNTLGFMESSESIHFTQMIPKIIIVFILCIAIATITGTTTAILVPDDLFDYSIYSDDIEWINENVYILNDSYNSNDWDTLEMLYQENNRGLSLWSKYEHFQLFMDIKELENLKQLVNDDSSAWEYSSYIISDVIEDMHYFDLNPNLIDEHASLWIEEITQLLNSVGIDETTYSNIIDGCFTNGYMDSWCVEEMVQEVK